jgi:hypothetical protein
VRLRFFERHVEHFLSAANPPKLRFFDQAADANRLLSFAGGKYVESGTILVTPGIMGEEIFDGGDAKAHELPDATRMHSAEAAYRCGEGMAVSGIGHRTEFAAAHP